MCRFAFLPFIHRPNGPLQLVEQVGHEQRGSKWGTVRIESGRTGGLLPFRFVPWFGPFFRFPTALPVVGGWRFRCRTVGGGGRRRCCCQFAGLQRAGNVLRPVAVWRAQYSYAYFGRFRRVPWVRLFSAVYFGLWKKGKKKKIWFEILFLFHNQKYISNGDAWLFMGRNTQNTRRLHPKESCNATRRNKHASNRTESIKITPLRSLLLPASFGPRKSLTQSFMLPVSSVVVGPLSPFTIVLPVPVLVLLLLVPPLPLLLPLLLLLLLPLSYIIARLRSSCFMLQSRR